jgi:hypothetical protein
MLSRASIIKIIGILGLFFTLLVEASAPAAALPNLLDAHAFPVIPYASARARRLALIGRRFGNRANVFSKVGDSITAMGYFLVPVGNGGLRLGGYENLGWAVQWFSQAMARTNNSFANESLAAMGGWTSYDVLDPNKAAPGICNGGATPLECELGVTRPSVALIMIGTNDLAHGNVAGFAANLNRIVTITENFGVIPVLSTIPDRRDNLDLGNRVAAFNDVIIRTALAHGIPLWNYWLAIQNLSNNGLSTDGVHPSVPPDQNTAVFDDFHLQYGFTMRNLTALQVLNNLLPVLR